MKAILTGITGNLGHEVANDLTRRGFELVPVVRPGKKLDSHNFSEIIYNDLLSTDKINPFSTANCIVHCAGIVHFKNAGNANQQIMLKMIDLAQRLKIPLYFVSTAFVYKPDGRYNHFNNSYEQDKWQSEQLLLESNIPFGIFRPSILVGNSKTGKIQNFSGYYFVVEAFLSAIQHSAQAGLKLRFPKLLGKTNMVSTDQVAECIGKSLENGRQEILFITNPEPPTFDWLLSETLGYFGLLDQVDFIDCSFEEFGTLGLTDIEKRLYRLGTHFNPYWSISYGFPNTICKESLINQTYLAKILDYFRKSPAHAQGH